MDFYFYSFLCLDLWGHWGSGVPGLLPARIHTQSKLNLFLVKCPEAKPALNAESLSSAGGVEDNI